MNFFMHRERERERESIIVKKGIVVELICTWSSKFARSF